MEIETGIPPLTIVKSTPKALGHIILWLLDRCLTDFPPNEYLTESISVLATLKLRHRLVLYSVEDDEDQYLNSVCGTY